VTNYVCKVGCSITDEALERIADARNRAVVIQHKCVGKGDQQKEIQEAGHVEPLTALGRREGFLNAKPNEHDRGEREYDAESHRINGGCRACGQ
jgi:hypothetical protein